LPVCDTRDKLTGMETTAKKPLIGGRKKDPRVSDLHRKYHRKARESAEIEARKKLQEPPSPKRILRVRHESGFYIVGRRKTLNLATSRITQELPERH
jgi:hypothetical protein